MVAIFFTTLAICQVVAGYICAKGIYCITKLAWLSVLVVLLSAAAPFSMYLVNRSLRESWLVDCVAHFGYIYQGIILYFSFFCIFAFLAFKINDSINLHNIMFAGLILTFVLLIFGYFNAIHARLKKIVIPADRNFKMCFVSDIHIGSISCVKILNNVVKVIEQCNPDVVILGGDVLDFCSKNYTSQFLDIMKKMTSKYKTYAIIGNHEVYVGVQDCIHLQKKAGIEMLLDTCVKLDNGFSVIGRLDKTFYWRKKLTELVPEDKSHLIVVDHVPDSIEESVKNGVMLHLSGHTHGGQIFPINLITNMLYEQTGMLKKNQNTYYYISYGAGFWGPPYRIGSIPEVVLVEFTKNS